MYNDDQEIRQIFASSNKIGSIILEFFMFSKFSHTGLVIDDIVYEARLFKGVIKTPYEDFKKEYSGYFEEHIIPATQEEKRLAKEFSEDQVGKKYDHWGVFAFPFRKAFWQDSDRWFCSEYNAAALVRSGIINITQKLSRISPRDLWIIITNR